MLYDPKCEGMVWDEYPDLAFLKEVSNSPICPPIFKDSNIANLDLLCKFCLWLISTDSPIFGTKDLMLRKKKALTRADIKSSSPVHEEIKTEGEIYQAVLSAIFRVINRDTYELWFSMKCSLLNLNTKARSPKTEVSEVLKIMSTIKDLTVQVSSMENAIFGGQSITDIVNRSTIRQQYAELYAEVLPHLK